MLEGKAWRLKPARDMASTVQRGLLLSEAERKEQEERSVITELLFFASTGNVARMQALIALYNTNVRHPCRVTAKM